MGTWQTVAAEASHKHIDGGQDSDFQRGGGRERVRG